MSARLRRLTARASAASVPAHMAPPAGELSAEQTEGAEKAEVFPSAGVRSQSSLPPSKPAALPPPSSEGGKRDYSAYSRRAGGASPSPTVRRKAMKKASPWGRQFPYRLAALGTSPGGGSMRRGESTNVRRDAESGRADRMRASGGRVFSYGLAHSKNSRQNTTFYPMAHDLATSA